MSLIRNLVECEDCKRRRERLAKMAALMRARFDSILGREPAPAAAVEEDAPVLVDSWADHIEDAPYMGVESVDAPQVGVEMVDAPHLGVVIVEDQPDTKADNGQ